MWYHKFVRTQVFHHAHSYSYEVETLSSLPYIRTTGSGFTSQRECRRHLLSDVRYILKKLDVMKRKKIIPIPRLDPRHNVRSSPSGLDSLVSQISTAGNLKPIMTKRMRRTKPMKRAVIDEDAVRELDLYSQTTSELYPMKMAILKNMVAKKKKGKYDPSKAPKGWLHWVDTAAKRYVKEFATPGDKVFTKADREALATELARRFERGDMMGEY